MVTLDQAREIFPTLFKEYEKKVGPQTVLDILNESDMDENITRAALNGDEDTTTRGGRGGKVDDDFEEDDDEDYDEEGTRRRRSKRKKKTVTPAKKAKQNSTETARSDESEKKPAKKRSPPKKAAEEVQPENAAASSTTTTAVAAPSAPLRIPVTQEEAIETEICRLEQELMADRVEEDAEEIDEDCLWTPPKWCVPIRADVRNFDFEALAKSQRELTGRLFDVIVTDPPWQLATSNPTRGVALGYEQLGDNFIRDMPFSKLQDNGFLFMWVINAKYRFALSLFELWGYELVDEITWVKQTVNRRLAKSHGFYLQHAKETCLVGRKGNDPPGTNRNKGGGDIIFSERRGQSQKPTEIYEAIERLVPGGYYLEIFGRRNNTRDGFVTIGNEL